jgi:hypothetical protein
MFPDKIKAGWKLVFEEWHMNGLVDLLGYAEVISSGFY